MARSSLKTSEIESGHWYPIGNDMFYDKIFYIPANSAGFFPIYFSLLYSFTTLPINSLILLSVCSYISSSLS